MKPLDIWLKHEVLKMKVGNDNLLIEPEKSRAGFEVSLIPLTKEFTIGSPMLFRVEMENMSNETLGYTHTSFMVNDPMLVKDSNSTIVPYIDTSYQTIARSEFVEPGETVILADNYDVRSQYHITKSGNYTFQFRGSWNIKPSNIVKKHIEFKPPPALESIVEDILPVLPEGWKLTRRLMPANELAETSTAKEVAWIHLIGKQIVEKGRFLRILDQKDLLHRYVWRYPVDASPITPEPHKTSHSKRDLRCLERPVAPEVCLLHSGSHEPVLCDSVSMLSVDPAAMSYRDPIAFYAAQQGIGPKRTMFQLVGRGHDGCNDTIVCERDFPRRLCDLSSLF